MAKLKLTKNELKKQKDDLKRFNRYLPTLILKKQQLQMEIQKVEHAHHEKENQLNMIRESVSHWVDVFGEDIRVEDYVKMAAVNIEQGNVAGIDIPIFKSIEFQEVIYDLFTTPLWVDRAVIELMKIYELLAEMKVLEEQIELLREELRVTSQRVNLFEKVKIPEAKHNIRVIQIFLGDQQTAAVVRGKISKNKIVKVQ
jgi:V/A-type H+-transporting ATPase subunit D